jgi:hypothetical protein
MELSDEHNPDADEQSPHDLCAKNSPEQYFVLIGSGDFEEHEDEKEDKQVIDAQRKLDQITGEKLQCRFLAAPEEQSEIEQKSERDPDRAPAKGFLDLDLMTLSLKKPKIHHQEPDDSDREKDVEKWSCRHHSINANVEASLETYEGRMKNTTRAGDGCDAGDRQVNDQLQDPGI